MKTTGALGALSDHFRGSAGRFRRMGSPFNERLAQGTTHAPDVLTLALRAGPGQPPCYLLFGAVHSLLLQRPDTPLARYYPSIVESPLPPDGLFPAFRNFCREHEDELSAILRTRTVQFTTAGRAAHVLPAIVEVARRAGEPLSLIEIGSSAGVLTLFDRYRYEYGAAGALGDPGAPLVSIGPYRDLPPLPREFPAIARRAGVDLHPIDPRDPSERRWLEALLPPDWTEERRLLCDALDLRAAVPLEILAGDALDIVPRLLGEMPDPICILHAHCLYQWPLPLHHAFEIILREASRGRTLHRIGLELADPRWSPVPEPSIHAADPDLAYETIHSVYRDGEHHARRLTVHDGFGKKAIWLARATDTEERG